MLYSKRHKHKNQPWTSLFITAAHERTKSLQIKQKTTVFLSNKTYLKLYFFYTRIVNCETHNKLGLFHNVCVLHKKLSARLFVLLRMSCLTGQSRHETRKKRCSVCTLLSWFTANEEQIPVDTTFGVNSVSRDYVMERTRSDEDIYNKRGRSNRSDI